ncbi:MAG: hypothetical protein HY698_11605 [Deltaproteobacteria bacterium]|nr:hypothetical protein [Deltaproteobacteria bacterium]
MHRLKQDLTKQAVETDTDFFVALVERAPDRSLLQIAAQACAAVLLENPQKSTAERQRRLAKYLDHDTGQKLSDLVEPEYPGLPEWQFDMLEAWFTNKYVPYREWTYRHGVTGDARGWAACSAAEFARHYLGYYVSARVGGDGADHLAWVKSARLKRRDTECAFLLVVLDGLAQPDAVRLASSILHESGRLSLDRQTLALSPIPTVTTIAKPAVAKGMLPSDAIQDTTAIFYTSVEKAGQALRNAAPGDVLVWVLEEPDRTYHYRADKGPDSVRLEADAQLLTIAKNIAELAEKAPSALRLSVVITTDHGRLLANTGRTRHVPQGMKAHGRAAWGACEVPFDKSGYLVKEDLAYLDAARFGLPGGQVYAVIVSDQAFVTTDGRGGNEPFPHGGLFPEEVLVPWLEFTRDRAPFTVEVTLKGKGEEGKRGTAVLTVQNLGPIRIKVTGLTADILDTRLSLDEEVGALDKRNIQVVLPKWPSRQHINTLMMGLTYLLPDGQPVRWDFRPEIETESLYDRPDILGELGSV